MTTATSIFRILAALTSTAMLMSPIPSMYRIWRTKSTGVASIIPLVSLVADAYSDMLYGYVVELYFPVFSTFALGTVLAIIYVSIFYYYTNERAKAHKAFILCAIPLTFITLYAFLGGYGYTGQSRHEVGNVLGCIVIVASLVLYSSPMERIGLVLKHRSAVFLNVHMISAGVFNNAMWVVYAYLIGNWILLSPCAFSGAMGVFQLLLYFVFHPSSHPIQVSTPISTEADLEKAKSPDFITLPSPLPTNDT